MLTFQDFFVFAPGAKTCPTGSWASEGTPERTRKRLQNDATWNPGFWWGHGGGVVWSHELLGSRTSWGAIGQRWKTYEKMTIHKFVAPYLFYWHQCSHRTKARGGDLIVRLHARKSKTCVSTRIDCKCQMLIILIKASYSDKGQIIETSQSWQRELHLRSKVCVFIFLYIYTQFTSH